MNSDKFDRIVLDLLYGELDELTTAAAKRHMDQSARAREIFAHFKATRQLSVLPTHSPPGNFEAALMERERRALAELPLHHRFGRIVSMLAGYAMRPQLIMGALLLLMIGSSLMFLRARPGQHSAVQVTERGAPEADVDLVLPVMPATSEGSPALASGVFQALPTVDLEPAPNAPAGPVAARPSDVRAGADGSVDGLDPFEQALDLYRSGHYLEAQRRFERISRSGGGRAAEAALYAAQSVRSASGCATAVNRFERVRLEFPGSASAYEAAWRSAKCQQQLGDVEAARQSYESLLQVVSHADRARAALTGLGAPAAGAAAGRLPPDTDRLASPGAAGKSGPK
jgi:TolA-binding protein